MRRWILAAAVAAVAALALAATASADVPRYQTQSATLTASVLGGAYVHIYTITINPCDGSFSGTAAAGSVVPGETVDGTLTDGNLSIVFHGMYPNSYEWTYDGPLSGGTGYGPGGQTFSVTFSLGLGDMSNWKNHGQYVKAQGGGSVAGQSCIGRPIPFSWSQSGTVDSASAIGTTVSLPDAGTYRIDVSGTWDNGVWYDVDAEYVQQADLSWAQGWPGYPTVDFGDLMVNGSFIDWGAYTAAHTYSYTAYFGSSPLNLRVWDMWGDLVTDGHADNVGSLNYTITYVGP